MNTAVVLASTLVALALAACSVPAPGAPELLGKWSFEQTDPDGAHGMRATYDFESDGSFAMSGYPPIEVRGRWRVLERAPGKLHLRLTDQKMRTSAGGAATPWRDEDAWGELAGDGRTFTYRGKTWRKRD